MPTILGSPSVGPPVLDVENGHGMDAEPGADCRKRQAVIGEQRPDCQNVIVGQAPRMRNVPTFLHTVLKILRARAEEQVGGFDAGAVIAGMANVDSRGHGTDEQLVRGGMGAHHASIHAERSVPAVHLSGEPQPAPGFGWRRINLRQETGANGVPIHRTLTGRPRNVAGAARFRARCFRFAAKGTRQTGYTHRVNLLNRLAGPRALALPRGFVVPRILPRFGGICRINGGL